MNSTNGTRQLYFDHCEELAWMCEYLAEKLVEISKIRGQNLSDVISNVNGQGKTYTVKAYNSPLALRVS